MLDKILKYDLKSMGKSLIPLYIALIGTALLVKGLNLLKPVLSIFSYISNFVTVIFGLIMVAAIFYTFYVSVKIFHTKFFSEEGYLTNTLPVKKGNLLISKVIVGTIYLVITVFIMFISLIIVMNFSDVVDFFKNIMFLLSSVFDNSEAAIIIYTVVTIIVSYLSLLIMIYAGIGLGWAHSKSKVMYSAVYCIILYFIGQIASVVLLLIMSFIYPDLMNMLEQSTPSADVINPIMISSLVITILLTIAYYLIANYKLKKLNLQ